MTWFEVLVEGGSDVPAVREVFTRRFGLAENQHFRIHPHKGRGKLPDNVLAQPSPQQQTLLHQLPAKLRGYSDLGNDVCVVVVLDADDTPCHELVAELKGMLLQLPRRPQRVLFRLAIEETESWFLADEAAVLKAFPKAKTQKMRHINPDSVVGAWEMLAGVLGMKAKDVTGADKHAWAAAIAPHLDLDNPGSPSLRKLIQGVNRELPAN